MRNMIKLPVVAVGLLLLLIGNTQTVKAQHEDISLQIFYDELSPYGEWIQDRQYGYVWRPDVDQNEFRPYYTNGRWAMTEYGNTWVSNYDWGWAPFHYGRWVHSRYNNWLWIPDTIWGPAWVSWRTGNGFYGWAPLGPSVNINLNFGRNRNRYIISDFCWNFIPQRNIYFNNFGRHNWRRNNVFIQNTVIINNTYIHNQNTYYTGPRAEEIRRATNQDVTIYNVNRSNRPGAIRIDNKNNNINIYSPRPSRGEANGNRVDNNNGQRNGRAERGAEATQNNGNGRENNNSVITRPARGGNEGNTITGRDNSVITRPARGGNEDNIRLSMGNNRVGVAPPRQNTDGENGRPVVLGTDRGSNDHQPQRVDRSRSMSPQNQPQPQHEERNRDVPQQQPQREERQPQREERSRDVPQQQPQREERSRDVPKPVEPAPQSRSSETKSSETNGERSRTETGGRPTRGGGF